MRWVEKGKEFLLSFLRKFRRANALGKRKVQEPFSVSRLLSNKKPALNPEDVKEATSRPRAVKELTSLDEGAAPSMIIKDFELSLRELAFQCDSEKFKVFIEELGATVSSTQDGQAIALSEVEELVDRLDDLSSFIEGVSIPETDREVLASAKELISCFLESRGAELLCSSSWNPETQRAISKTCCPNISEPKIESYGATGFKLNGELIRKQEVCLSVPEQN